MGLFEGIRTSPVSTAYRRKFCSLPTGFSTSTAPSRRSWRTGCWKTDARTWTAGRKDSFKRSLYALTAKFAHLNVRSLKLPRDLFRGHIPHLDHSGHIRGGEEGPVFAAEGRLVHGIFESRLEVDYFEVCHVPDDEPVVLAAGRDVSGLRVYCAAEYGFWKIAQ